MEHNLRKHAEDTLRGALLDWRLTDSQWQAVTQAVDRLADALATDDASSFDKALGALVMIGQGRVKIEDAEKLPAPEPVRNRIGEVIHTLDGRPVDPRDTHDAATGTAS